MKTVLPLPLELSGKMGHILKHPCILFHLLLNFIKKSFHIDEILNKHPKL